MSVAPIIWIIAALAASYLILRWMLGPFGDDDRKPSKNQSPSCCDMVAVSDIEPPHGDCTASVLKKLYLEAEQEIVDAHDRIMEGSIRRSMADSLLQGWPVDVAVSQACYTFMSGVCRCPTCRNIING